MADRMDPDSHMQQHIECCVCFQVYNTTDRKPKTLPCGHTFCEVCLQTLVKSKGSTVSCPLDRTQITIPSGGVSDLPTSFSILSMADNACDECHAKPKKLRCLPDHCQKTLCVGCFDDHCKLFGGSLKTSLKELHDEMDTLQAECDDDEDVQLLEEQCSEAIEAVSLICDELKQHLVQGIKERSVSDKETLLKWKQNMGMKITNTKSFIRESLSKLSTVTSALADVMGDIQKTLLIEKDSINAEGKKPLTTSFHPKDLEQEIKTMLPNLMMILMSLSAAVLGNLSNMAKVVPDYTCAKMQCMSGSLHAEGKLFSPSGICCSLTGGYLAIVDNWDHRIQILNDKLQHLLTFGREGFRENQYKLPAGVTVNSQGNLFITDTYNHRIQIVSSDGQYLSKLGTKGSGMGQYDQPWGISCDEDDLLHICDYNNTRVQVVKENGEFVRFMGCKGDNPGVFTHPPWNIASSRVHNRVIACDTPGNLHFFTHMGQFIKTIKAEQPPYYMKAYCVAIDHVGNVIIGDGKRHRLVVLGPDGDLLSTIGGPGEGPGQFNCPIGIAVTRDGCLYVSDYNHHIQLFHVPMRTP